MIWYVFFIIFLIGLPSCKKASLKSEFSTLQQKTKKRIGAHLKWQPILSKTNQQIEKQVNQGISYKDTIGISLLNNAELQTKLEELGIATSDLLQAGFYSNPHLESIFRIPKRGETANIESTLRLSLSDLWQVPLRKKVAQDELEIKSLSLLQLILDVVAQTKMAYASCLFAKENLKITLYILNTVKDLRNKIYYRQKFGYTNDLDKYFADMKVGEWENIVLEHEMMLQSAYLELRRILGITISPTPVNIIDTLFKPIVLPNKQILEDYAFHHRPELQIVDTKILQAKHTISLEKAHIFDNVSVGVSYDKDFDRDKGVGPLFGISIPLFNQNYGNIKRAKYQLKEAHKELIAKQQFVQEEIQHAYIHYQYLLKQVNIYYEQIIPSSKKVIEFATKYFDAMQLNMITLLDSYIAFYKAEKALLRTQYEATQSLIKLERVVSTEITNFNDIN